MPLKFIIQQIIKNEPKDCDKCGAARGIIVDWTEDQIIFHLKNNMPVHTHPALEKAWDKVINLFKMESIKIN